MTTLSAGGADTPPGTRRDDLSSALADDAPTLHLIGHAHIDPVWLWQWPEGFQEIKATFRSALDRMAENDEFVFTASSAAFYEWVQRNDPAMFGEIAARVAEGRWYVVGGWWVEADCNLAGAESYARQALLGQRWFQRHLGVTATVGFNPDSFGHHAMLPQLLAKSGLSHYVFMRPNDRELDLPGRTFWWESSDGSRVLAFRIPFDYLCWPERLEAHVRRCSDELESPPSHMMCFYGVGNHGGGPTRENLETIDRLRNEASGLPKLVMSDPGRFFEAAEGSGAPLPVVRGELQHHAAGCYAAHSGIKRWNRRAERLLLDAERLSAVAARVVGHQPSEDLGRAWKNLLFNQFHDILAGTSIEPAYTDARDQLGEAAAIAGRAMNDALQSLSWNVEVPAEPAAIPVVVWNPHSWEAPVPVELEVGRLPVDPVLVDDEGRREPVQQVQSLATVDGGRARIAFLASVPPVGYRLYRVVAGGHPRDDMPKIDAGDAALDNGLIRVEFDEVGGVRRICDQRQGVEVAGPQSLRADVIEDASDTWSHGVAEFGTVVGAFEVERIRCVEHGPIRSTVRIESRYGASRLVQDFVLYRGLPYLDVRATVDWRERFKLLKLRVPVAVRDPEVTYDIPFGAIRRDNDGHEVVGQRWVDVTGRLDGGQRYGLSLVTDSKQSFDVRGALIGLTVLRSPIHAHHDPRVPSDDEEYSFLDQGIQRFVYRLVPHDGGWEDAGIVRLAAELNHPHTFLVESPHAGGLPASDCFLRIDAPSVVLTALKEAEDGGALIVRCHESAGRPSSAVVELPRWRRRFDASFGPWEVKTFRVPDDPHAPVAEVDLLEQDASG